MKKNLSIQTKMHLILYVPIKPHIFLQYIIMLMELLNKWEELIL